jgi:outer membrane protein assembly factor BamD (BamD/ComL family)
MSRGSRLSPVVSRSLTPNSGLTNMPRFSIRNLFWTAAESTRPMSLAKAALAALLVVAAGVSPEAEAADRILMKGGRPLSVDEITADNYDKVEFRKNNATGSQPAAKVRAIEYGDAPESYQLALEKREAGEFENAANLLKSAIGQSGVRGWIKVQGNFELAETLRRWAARDRTRFAQAIAAYDEVLKAEKSRFRPDALLGRALSHLGAGDLGKAKADLAQLKKEATDNKYGPGWELRADFTLAQALEEAGDAEAKRAYQSLETFAKSYAANQDIDAADRAYAGELAGLAKLAQGRALLRENRGADAERFFAQIAGDSAEPAAVRAQAVVGVGQAYLAQNKLKEAQLAFAKVRIQHRDQIEATAEATYQLGIVCEALGAAEPRGAALAQEYFKECVQRFGASRIASKAQEKIR